MSRRFAFDEAGVEALAAGEREWRAWDEALKGFGVRIRPSGSKSWIVNAAARGADGRVRSRRITLGRCGEMSLEEARTEARKHLGVAAPAVADARAAGMEERAAGDRSPAPDGPEAAAEDPAAGLAAALAGIRGAVDRIEAWSARTGPQVERLSAHADAADRRRWRPAKAVLGLALAAALGFAGGAVLQNRLPILPPVDPTLGWKDHIWEHYGGAITDCYQRARNEEAGRVKCGIEVRAK